MIFDNAKNVKSYAFNDKFKKVFEFIEKTDFDKLPLGKTEIDGKDVFVNFMEYETKEPIKDFEAHKLYADVQYIVSGNERIDYAEIDDGEISIPYNTEKDVLFFKEEKFSPLKIKQGEFAIFYPQDAHRPSLSDDKICKVKKAVFKVKL